MNDEQNTSTDSPESESQNTSVPPVVTPPPAPVVGTTQPVAHTGTNGLAVAALVVGIVAFISGWVPFWGFFVGAAAVVLGILGVRKANGKGMAIAGIVTGGLAALFGIFMTVITVLAWGTVATTAGTIQNTVNKADQESQAIIDAKKDFEKGATAVFDKYEVKVNSVTRNYSTGNQYLKPDSGNEFVLVNVTVKNIGKDSEYLSPSDFDISDNGLASMPTYYSVDNSLDSGDLASGASTTGNILYEVTKDATGLKLQFKETVYLLSSGESKEVVYTLAL